MSLPEHELERIGLLASRVQDGEATDAEAVELARLRTAHPEVRALCDELGMADAALRAAVPALPAGFAERVTFRTANEPPAPVTIRGPWAAVAAAAASIAVLAVGWSLWSGDAPPAAGPTVAKSKPAPSEPQPATPPERYEFPEPATERQPAVPVPADPAEQGDTSTRRLPALEPRPQVERDPPAAPPPAAPAAPAPPEGGAGARSGPTGPSLPHLALVDDLIGTVRIQRAGQSTWEAVTKVDAVYVNAGDTVEAHEGSVALALSAGGHLLLQRGAKVELIAIEHAIEVGREDKSTTAMRVSRGRVLVDCDFGGECAVKCDDEGNLRADSGGRYVVDVADDGATITAVQGSTELPVGARLSQRSQLRLRAGDAHATPLTSSPRLLPHELAFLAARVGRETDPLWRLTPGWGRERAQLERLTREALAATASPSALLAMLRAAADGGASADDAAVLLRSLALACAGQADSRTTARALGALAARGVRGADLAAAAAAHARGEPDARPERERPEPPDGQPGRRGGGGGRQRMPGRR